jgi:uncharacterized membrane protein
MVDLLDWLNTNNGAVTATAKVAGVLVVIGYSIFAALQWSARDMKTNRFRIIAVGGLIAVGSF